MLDDPDRDRAEELRTFELVQPLLTILALAALAIVAWLFWGVF